MNVIVDFCLVPLGVGVGLSSYVAACHEVLADSNLSYQLHANGTNIEGQWDEVFAAVKKCHQRVHQIGAPRIFTTIKIGTRTDRVQHMQEKIRSVEEKLREPLAGSTTMERGTSNSGKKNDSKINLERSNRR